MIHLHRRGAGRSAPVRRRYRAGLTFAALTAVLGVAASACGNSGPSEGALAGKSATSVLTLSITAYHRQKSVAFVTKTISGKTSTLEVGATSKTAASESVRSGQVPVLDALLTGGTAYLRAGSSFLENQLGLPTAQAAANAGHWISFQKGNPGYSEIVQSLSAGEAILAFVPQQPNFRVAGATTFNGTERVGRVRSTGLDTRARYDGQGDTFRLDHGALPAAGCHRPGEQRQRAPCRAGGDSVRKVQLEGPPRSANRCGPHHLARFVLIGGAPGASACSGSAAVGPDAVVHVTHRQRAHPLRRLQAVQLVEHPRRARGWPQGRSRNSEDATTSAEFGPVVPHHVGRR